MLPFEKLVQVAFVTECAKAKLQVTPSAATPTGKRLMPNNNSRVNIRSIDLVPLRSIGSEPHWIQTMRQRDQYTYKGTNVQGSIDLLEFLAVRKMHQNKKVSTTKMNLGIADLKRNEASAQSKSAKQRWFQKKPTFRTL